MTRGSLADLAAFRPLGDVARLRVQEGYAPGRFASPRLGAGIRLLAQCRQGRVVVNVLKAIHDAFPAQFGQLALELSRDRGWQCRFLVQSLSSCPTPSQEMLKAVELHLVPKSAEHRSSDGIPWPQIFGHYLDQCQTIHDTIKAMPHLRPDLVVAHGGRGAPSLFLREVVDCPIVIYCEYYFARSHRDISYRIDLPPAELCAVLSALDQRPDTRDTGRLRRRLLGHCLAEAVISGQVSLQDRSPFRRHRYCALRAWTGAAADRREVDTRRHSGGDFCLARA